VRAGGDLGEHAALAHARVAAEQQQSL